MSIELFLNKANHLFDGMWRTATLNGNGRFGNAIEGALGIVPNNRKSADFGEGNNRIEIKSSDNSSNTLLTLFSKAPNLYYNPLTEVGLSRGCNSAFSQHGYVVNEDKYSHRINVTADCTKRHEAVGDDGEKKYFSLSLDSSYLRLTAEEFDGAEIASVGWDVDTIVRSASNKIGATLVYFSFDQRSNIAPSGPRISEYRVTKLEVFSDFSEEKLLTSIKDGKIKLDSRLGKRRRGRGCRDHGSAFRINHSDLDSIYNYSDTPFVLNKGL